MVVVLMELATVPLVLWGRLVNKECVPTDAHVTGDAMVSQVAVSVMLAMGGLIALSLCVQIVKMASVVMMPRACAKSAGREKLVMRSLVMETARRMVANATMETVCALPVLLVFNVRHELTSAPTNAVETECVTSGQSSAIVRKASLDLIAPSLHARMVATNPMASAMPASATVHQTGLGKTAQRRSAPTTVVETASVTRIHVCVTATQGGLVMTAASKHVLGN